jgi:cytochrome c oxidase assembly protein subunit 15
MAIPLWVAWFVLHLPCLSIAESISIPALLGIWLLSAIAAGAAVPDRHLFRGALAGLVSAVVGLLLLGSKLVEPSAGDTAAGLLPSAGLIAIGFVGAGIVIGAFGGLIGSIFAQHAGQPEWLARFGLIAALAAAPLLFIGGLVTSTNSGMAVPDWPNTYGSNMFLYPLGPRARPDVYLEHSHRLFGTLVGCAVLTLTIWVLAKERRGWVKSLTLVALALVVTQGVLGGGRVIANSTAAGLVHGVLAQLVFGLIVSVAVVLSPTWRTMSVPNKPPGLRRLRLFATGLLHSTILQLIFGAMYRHLRDAHSLWTHAGFSVIVVILAAATGFAAVATAAQFGDSAPLFRRLGRAILAVVLIQFLLGWTAFFAGGTGREAPTAAAALLRTAHQANGALLLGLATALFLYTRRALSTSAEARPLPV